jgi:hypothetical protein
MMTIEDILAAEKNRKVKPTEGDLRKLPWKKSFIYGRVSSPGQVRDSKESIREIAKNVALAKSDGYHSDITAEETERFLLSIQQGSAVDRIMQGGDIILDVQDLGISAKGLGVSREGKSAQSMLPKAPVDCPVTRTGYCHTDCLNSSKSSNVASEPQRGYGIRR